MARTREERFSGTMPDSIVVVTDTILFSGRGYSAFMIPSTTDATFSTFEINGKDFSAHIADIPRDTIQPATVTNAVLTAGKLFLYL